MSESITEGNSEQKRPPTSTGDAFTISDLGFDDGGKAVSVIADTFEDCFEELALIVENEYGQNNVYSFKNRSPIYCCHIPEEAYNPEEHGDQTVGFRYSYKFIEDINTNNPIRVVEWEETKFTEITSVVYP